MVWVYCHQKSFNSFRAGTVFIRQNLTPKDVAVRFLALNLDNNDSSLMMWLHTNLAGDDLWESKHPGIHVESAEMCFQLVMNLLKKFGAARMRGQVISLALVIMSRMSSGRRWETCICMHGPQITGNVQINHHKSNKFGTQVFFILMYKMFTIKSPVLTCIMTLTLHNYTIITT